MDLIGDEAEYTTRFGVKLKSIRNQRTLNAFMGYRKFDEEGNTSLVMEEYQVVLDKPSGRSERNSTHLFQALRKLEELDNLALNFQIFLI